MDCRQLSNDIATAMSTGMDASMVLGAILFLVGLVLGAFAVRAFGR